MPCLYQSFERKEGLWAWPAEKWALLGRMVPGRLPVGGEGRLPKGCITFQLLLEGQIENKIVNEGLKRNSR